MPGLLGFGQGVNSGIQGAANATAARTGDLNLQSLIEQAQARAAMAKILAQYTQNQGQQAPVTPPTPSPVFGGVSPPNGNGYPMGGAPAGGEGSAVPGATPPFVSTSPGVGAPGTTPSFVSQTANTGMGGAPGAIDLQKLVAAIMASQTNPGAQGFALQDTMKLLQPQANQAVKFDIATGNRESRENIASANRESRENIAEMSNATRRELAQYNAQIKNIPVAQLNSELGHVSNALRAALSGSDDAKFYQGKFNALMDEIDSRRSAHGLPAKERPEAMFPDTPPAPLPEAPAAASTALPADTPTATDAKGNTVYYNGTAWVPLGSK